MGQRVSWYVWAYHTRTSTNETSFNLVFDTEAVIPVEIGFPTMRVELYNESSNLIQLRTNLDLIEETRDKAHLRMCNTGNESPDTTILRSGPKLSTLKTSSCIGLIS